MAYAKNSKVSVDKTIGDIRKVIEKAGASGFAYAERDNKAQIMFMFRNGRGVRMTLRMPPPPSNPTEANKRSYDQIKRSKWRCLLLCIKAKVESIESGIETFEEAFLPHLVLSNGDTVGQKVIGKIQELDDRSPSLLLGL